MYHAPLVEEVLLGLACVGTFLLEKRHDAVLDTLPEAERDVMCELLRYQAIALVLFLLVVGLEVLRVQSGYTTMLARAAPAGVGMLAAVVRFAIRQRAHRIYELTAADGDQDRVCRARNLRGAAMVAFLASGVLWVGLLAHRAGLLALESLRRALAPRCACLSRRWSSSQS